MSLALNNWALVWIYSSYVVLMQDMNKTGQDMNKTGQDMNETGQDMNKTGQDMNKTGKNLLELCTETQFRWYLANAVIL